MNTKSLCAALLLLAMFTQTSSLWCMRQNLRRNINLGALAATLYAAGTAYDEVQGKKLKFVDVSTPSLLKVLADRPHNTQDVNRLTHSITKLQLESDTYLTHGPVTLAKSGLSSCYTRQVDGVLFSHFWVFLPTMRNKLVGLVTQLSHDEQTQREQGNITLVHGTNQGASILLRTVFDEVLQRDTPHQNFVRLRSQQEAQELAEYADVHQYYNDNIGQAPIKPIYQRAHSGATVKIGEYVMFDKGPAQKHILATNFGFFGQNWWGRDGYKQSSAEFVTLPCSWGYQALVLAMPLIGGAASAYVGTALDLIRNPGHITSLYAVLDSNLKGFPRFNLCEAIFKEYGAEHLYQKYRDELNHMELIAHSGLVHLFIPEEYAKRWCYVSYALGIRAYSNPSEIIAFENPETRQSTELYNQQVRVLLHPEMCNSANVSMRFYLLGKPEKIQAMTERLYEIAREIKAFKEKDGHN